MIETFIKRPVFTTMFILVLVVFGIRSYPTLGIDLYPDIDLPLVGVTVTYEGTAPEEMETLVTKPIENRVSQVSGIKTISSTIREGYSQTVLEFEIGTDPRQMASEVREKVAGVRKRLPDDIDEPVVQRFDMASMPPPNAVRGKSAGFCMMPWARTWKCWTAWPMCPFPVPATAPSRSM